MTDIINDPRNGSAPQELRPYPDGPGHRGVDTSLEAAQAIAPRVGTLQAKALAAIREAGDRGLTTVELARVLLADSSSIQPRTSELREKRLILDSGARRGNPSGINAIVWVARAEAA